MVWPRRTSFRQFNADLRRNSDISLVYAVEEDPLCYPDTNVLINLLDLRDQEELDEYEAAVFQVRFEEEWPSGSLDLDHYLSLHHHLFQDVYAWAGEIRDIRIHKDRTTFAYPENILMSLKAVFNDLATNKYLVDMEPREFAENAAHLLAEINAAHPFREGNGRTQLAFLSMVVENAGFPFNEDVIEPQTVVPAMIESFHSSNDALVKLIEKITAT